MEPVSNPPDKLTLKRQKLILRNMRAQTAKQTAEMTPEDQQLLQMVTAEPRRLSFMPSFAAIETQGEPGSRQESGIVIAVFEQEQHAKNFRRSHIQRGFVAPVWIRVFLDLDMIPLGDETARTS